MNENLPQLSGYALQSAEKVRLAYIRFLNSKAYTQYAVSRLDIGLYIDQIELQLKRIFTVSFKKKIEDFIYDKYLEPRYDEERGKTLYYLKEDCIKYGVMALDMLTKTQQWLDIKNRVQCFELIVRCVIFDFKRSKEFKNLLKREPYVPRFYDKEGMF